jgi:histidine triad (HIT) family protein
VRGKSFRRLTPALRTGTATSGDVGLKGGDRAPGDDGPAAGVIVASMATLFERIIAGELPADVVYRDEEIIAFRDIHPRARVHILVVPHKPIPTANDIADADAPLIGRLFTVARDLARREGIAEDGYRLVMNCNRNGGQEVYHLHLHLIGGEPLGPMTAKR